MNQWINESSVPKTAHQPLKLDCNLKRDMHWSSSCTEEASVSKGMHKELNLMFLRLDFVIYLLNLTSYASDWLKNISWPANLDWLSSKIAQKSQDLKQSSAPWTYLWVSHSE